MYISGWNQSGVEKKNFEESQKVFVDNSMTFVERLREIVYENERVD